MKLASLAIYFVRLQVSSGDRQTVPRLYRKTERSICVVSMFHVRPLSGGALCLVFALGCKAGASRDSTFAAKALSELRSADSSVAVAIKARDADLTASYYANDAVIMPVAEPIVTGRPAILKEWRHVFGIPGIANNSRLMAAAVSASGDLGYTRGTYESPMVSSSGQQVIERGKWVSVWKRDTDGNWRIVLDIFNTDASPPDHQPSTSERSQH